MSNEQPGLLKILNARALTPGMRAHAEEKVSELKEMLKAFYVESKGIKDPVLRASALAAHKAGKAFLVTCVELKVKKKRS
jgi:hypothetical protein